MELRQLGQSDLRVYPLCLGGNVFGWTANEEASFAVLDAYLEAGGNFVDTADVYARWAPGNSGGESESVLGRWMAARKNRSSVIIATKLGSEMGPGKRGLSRQYMMEAVEASLRRLQTDYIDLYQSHRDDEATPIEETLAAYGDLVRQGKVRVIGASNFTVERLAESVQISEEHGYPRYESLQPPFNLVQRESYAGALEAYCREHQIGVIPYSSLASGFLTGKYRPDQELPSSARAGGIQQRYMGERGFRILGDVDRVAEKHGATPAQVALAWLMARRGITAPIASATTVPQLHELLGAVTLKLDPESIAALDRVGADAGQPG
ncbi:MAG: aldo/keto reductase [Chloroflexi bacterium]|nr:aldo/keto reductase [Chloroflexota bacterium]